jgi:anti-sigma-K factor RskA
MTHEQATELLASYALDAVSTHEHDQLESHLSECPRCRAELDGYREVAAAMGNSVEPVPEGLWSSIAARLPERPQKEARAMPRLLPNRSANEPSDGTDGDLPVQPPRRQRFAKGPIGTIGSIAVAAAAIAAVFGVGLVRSQHTVDHDNNLISQQASQLSQVVAKKNLTPVEAALKTPGHTIVTMANGLSVVATFVLLPDGHGYLYRSSLPTLIPGHAYQLWGIVGSQPISLGLLGTTLNRSQFTVAGAHPSRLSITVESADGSIQPTGPVVASGTVT